jgi:hypothetical protein
MYNEAMTTSIINERAKWWTQKFEKKELTKIKRAH